MLFIFQTLCQNWRYSGKQETQSLILLQILAEPYVLWINGNQICPLADEWIRKLWYIYTMEYYSAIEKYV